jgi:hypothetical protein
VTRANHFNHKSSFRTRFFRAAAMLSLQYSKRTGDRIGSQSIGLREAFLSRGKPRSCRAPPRRSEPLNCGRMMWPGAIPGKNLTAFVWWTPPARFWAFSPKIPMAKGDNRRPLPSGSDAALERYVVDGRATALHRIYNRTMNRSASRSYQGSRRTVRESGTWTRKLDPHAGIKAARG